MYQENKSYFLVNALAVFIDTSVVLIFLMDAYSPLPSDPMIFRNYYNFIGCVFYLFLFLSKVTYPYLFLKNFYLFVSLQTAMFLSIAYLVYSGMYTVIK